MKSARRSLLGFTLIELLVVIGILAILFAIVLIAINPARQFSQANNTKRRSDINAILNAIHQYSASNRGNLPAGIPQVPASAANISNTGADLCAALIPTYISALPTDPSLNVDAITNCAVAYDSGYTVVRDASNRVTVAAPSADLTVEPPGTTSVSVTR